MLHELGFEKGRVLIQRTVFSACQDMLKKSISCKWASYFFLEYPFGTPYLELSSEIPAQDFNLLVNKDNFFPVFLLIIIGNSFHLFKFTLHLKNCFIGVTWGLSSKGVKITCSNYCGDNIQRIKEVNHWKITL